MKTQDKALVLGVLLALASAATIVAWKADQAGGTAKIRALVLYESGDLTPTVSSVIGSKEIRGYLATHGDEGLNFLCLDVDTPLDDLPAVWKQMAGEKPKTLPCIVVKAGRKMYAGTLPDSAQATLDLLKKYGGE